MAKVLINFSCNDFMRKKSVKEALGWFGRFNKFSSNSPDPVVMLSDARITLDGSIKILCPFLGDLFSSATNDSPIIMPDYSLKTFKTFYSVLTKGYAEDCQNLENVVDIASALDISMEGLIVEQVGGGLNENVNEDREYFEAVNENNTVGGIKVKNENRFIKCEENPVLSERQEESSDSSHNEDREYFEAVNEKNYVGGIKVKNEYYFIKCEEKPVLSERQGDSNDSSHNENRVYLEAVNENINVGGIKVKNENRFIKCEEKPVLSELHGESSDSSQNQKAVRENIKSRGILQGSSKCRNAANNNQKPHSIGNLSHVIKDNDTGYYDIAKAAEVSKNLFEVSDSLNKNGDSREFKCNACSKVFPKECALNSHKKAKHNKKETDVSILDYRKKQVDSFKRSNLYKFYTDSIPRKNRIGNAPPSISKYRTKRQWDRDMNCWKDRVRRKVESIEKKDENYYQNGKPKP